MFAGADARANLPPRRTLYLLFGGLQNSSADFPDALSAEVLTALPALTDWQVKGPDARSVGQSATPRAQGRLITNVVAGMLRHLRLRRKSSELVNRHSACACIQ